MCVRVLVCVFGAVWLARATVFELEALSSRARAPAFRCAMRRVAMSDEPSHRQNRVQIMLQNRLDYNNNMLTKYANI